MVARTYTRQDVCNLTGIAVARFKTLARRDQLPTIFVPAQGVSEESSDAVGELGWNRFSSADVIKIAIADRLMADFGYQKGLFPGEAAKMASNLGGEILQALERRSAGEQWVGYLSLATDGEPQGGFHLGGSLTAIWKKIRDASDDASTPDRLLLVNLSELVRGMCARAESFGIEFDPYTDAAE